MMYADDRENYFVFGDAAVRCIRLAMNATERTTFGNILDFPSGHGRVLRTLKAAFPEARLTACDMDRDGVDFCAETFGAKPIYSVEDPGRIELPGQYDLIWCGSLFTHLNAPRWQGFLELFEEALRPYGLLVFTTAGRYTAEMARRGKARFWWTESMLASYDQTGFGYDEYEARIKDEIGIATYGQSLSSLRWVMQQLEELALLRVVVAGERAWGAQDAIACEKGLNPGLGAEES
jgi:SAM-dependent methyltransferase